MYVLASPATAKKVREGLVEEAKKLINYQQVDHCLPTRRR
jgi:hypothetical protein